MIFVFLSTGDLFEIRRGEIMLNQLWGNKIDGSANNLYLRSRRGGELEVYPLLGVNSASSLQRGGSRVRWQGTAGGLAYSVDFCLAGQDLWFWDVQVEGADAEIDLIYGQDVGLANQDALLNNEAYVSQYVDHSVFEHPQLGYTVCSRQNLFQDGFPYLQQGSLTGAVGYSTDGFQFFGLGYKADNRPRALFHERLANKVYQYEFAYTALQSRRIVLQGKARFVFYGLFVSDHPGKVQGPVELQRVQEAWRRLTQRPAAELRPVKTDHKIFSRRILETEELSEEELDKLYPRRFHEEWEAGTLLSFFTSTHEHVVLRAKELLVERPHGHILMSGENDKMRSDLITTTCYMFGIFNAQLAVGHTSFHRFLSTSRNHLNLLKVSGQRLFVELEGAWTQFALPSAFEMGFNYARWYYKTADETFIITTFTVSDAQEIRFRVTTLSGKAYRFRLTYQVIMDQREYNSSYRLVERGANLIFRAGAGAANRRAYPDLAYLLHVAGDYSWWEEKDISLVVVESAKTAALEAVIEGRLVLGEKGFSPADLNFEEEVGKYRRFLHRVMGGFALEHSGAGRHLLAKLDSVIWWYTHNMLVHFSAPRGLEQSGGGGWGTRDVCQGPAEYFLAAGNYSTVREILLTVYSRQLAEDGSWPQWFMFDDRYLSIQAGESHGDIVIWPLKLLADYLQTAGDEELLLTDLPYVEKETRQFTEDKFSLLEHVERQIEYIKSNFLTGTYLSAYGDGDWNDTLQPADEELRRLLASSWTVALTFQALDQLAAALFESQAEVAAELGDLAERVKQDFEKYLLPEGTIPGFLYLEDARNPEYLLHPSDQRTGIEYRLLPQTRSIIGELVSRRQAARNMEVIQKRLRFPDGVRIMNRPANYRGGISEHFQRAEQAANFGREIGLQYVHAHLRFVEAAAKLGQAEDAWWGLEVVCPINLKDAVPNAELRQSNAYFSSSDGKFNTRYQAACDFHKLKTGEVGVKGGWRIYSSGPGIYFNQLVSNCLGIRRRGGILEIDPVLPDSLSGLRFGFSILGRQAHFVFYSGRGRKVMVNGEQVPCEELSNPYRKSGCGIRCTDLEQLLQPESNLIEVYL